MTKKDKIVMEEKNRFSQSLLWKMQREFYDEYGVNAWSEQVPFYITSNPYIANCYANLVVRFIQDWVGQYPNAIECPFYIIELGAGTGQFSFYVLKSINLCLEKLKLSDVIVKYVMTDFTQNNIDFWKEHAALKPYVEKKCLDFAIYDFEHDKSMDLLLEKQTLNTGDIKNPLVVFANYLFDTVTSDIFTIKNGEIKEALLSLSTHKKNLKDGKLIDYKKLSLSYSLRTISKEYYKDPILDKILFNYAKELEDSNILYPIGSLTGIKNLKALSNNRLLLISSDKGYTKIDELEDLEYPELDFHGSFSTMVNYHAIAEYFKLEGGDYFLQAPRDSLVTTLFADGFSLESLPELTWGWDQFIGQMSPLDFFNFYELLGETTKKAKLTILASYLTLSRWDPFIFEDISDRIEDLLPEADDDHANYLSANMHKIAENFYFTPGCHDVLFDIAVFYQTNEEYKKALHYFKLSQHYFGDDFALFFNYGLCHFYLEEYKFAFENFKKASELKPKEKEIKQWVAKAKRKMS